MEKLPMKMAGTQGGITSQSTPWRRRREFVLCAVQQHMELRPDPLALPTGVLTAKWGYAIVACAFKDTILSQLSILILGESGRGASAVDLQKQETLFSNQFPQLNPFNLFKWGDKVFHQIKLHQTVC
jgi:hypothetical protein